jgi:hypothetical protein
VGDRIFGGTGNVGHLFVYDTVTGKSTDLGVGYPGLSTVYSLIVGPEGRVYGISGSVYIEAHLYSLDPANPTIIEDEGAPIPTSTEVGSLVLAGRTIYGGARDAATVFAYDVDQGTYQTWDVSAAGIGYVECLALGPGGLLYGGGYAGYGQGRLFRFDPATGVAEGLGTAVPGDSTIASLVVGPDGRIYGGTALLSGYLFAYDAAAGTFQSYGAPVWRDNEVNALIRGSDGLLYGVTGWRHGRLFRFDPLHYPTVPAAGAATSISVTPRFRDRPPVPSTPEVWAMATASDGRVYVSGYGPTVLSRWDPASESMEMLGQVPGGASHVYALLELPDGQILGGGGTYGGVPVLFTFDPRSGQFALLPFYISGEHFVHSLARCPSGLIYGGTAGLHGWLFSYDPASGDIATLASPVADQDAILSLVCSPDGLLYGGTSPEADLFTFDPAAGQTVATLQPIPGESELWALAWGPDGRLYGGSGGAGLGLHGLLFAYDPFGAAVDVLGQPFPQDPAVYDLAAGSDGLIYGVTGGSQGHLFSFDPGAHSLIDRGKATLHDDYAYSLALSLDARHVYVGTGYNTGLLAEYDSTYRFAWLGLDYSAVTGPGTHLAIDVVNSAGETLLPDVPAGGSLLELSSSSDPAIQIRASLATSDTAATPALLDWTITWSRDPKLVLDPPALTFRAVAGGPPPFSQTLAVTNESAGELPWTASGIPAWLALDPAAGLAPSAVRASAHPEGLAPGVYRATLLMHGPADCLNCPVSLPVTLELLEEPFRTFVPMVWK